jgi:hypothetical protein
LVLVAKRDENRNTRTRRAGSEITLFAVPFNGCSRRNIGVVRHAAKIFDKRSADSRFGVERGRERLH